MTVNYAGKPARARLVFIGLLILFLTDYKHQAKLARIFHAFRSEVA